MEGIQALTARMKTYGIKISTPQIVLTLMANIKVTAREDFGREFRPDLQNISAKYTYSHTHDDASLKNILQELAKADSVQSLKDAPAPGTANAVTTMLKTMRTTVSTSSGKYNSSDEKDYTKLSLGVSSDDESMATSSTRRRHQKDKTTNKDKVGNKKGKEDDSGKRKKKNDCPH